MKECQKWKTRHICTYSQQERMSYILGESLAEMQWKHQLMRVISTWMSPPMYRYLDVITQMSSTNKYIINRLHCLSDLFIIPQIFSFG